MKNDLDKLVNDLILANNANGKGKEVAKTRERVRKNLIAMSDKELLLKVGYGLYYLLCSTKVYQNEEMSEEAIVAFRHDNKLRYRRLVRELGKELGVSANDIHNAYLSCSVNHLVKDAYIKIKHLGD